MRWLHGALCLVACFPAHAGVVLLTQGSTGGVQTKAIQHLDATFGFVPYGRTISGFVHYVGDGCKPMPYSMVTRFRNHIVHRGGTVLADRGACTLCAKFDSRNRQGQSSSS